MTIPNLVPVPCLTLRSAELGPGRAFETWRATVPQYAVSIPDGADAPFQADISAWLLDPIVVTAGRTSPAHLERSHQALTDGYDNVAFVLFQIGRWTGEADGRSVDIGSGEVCVFDHARPFRAECTAAQYVIVNVTRDALTRHFRALPDLHGRVPDGASGCLLAAHLAALARALPEMRQDQAGRIVQATLTLMVAALEELASTPPGPVQGTVPAIRRRVERYVAGHLASQDLSPESIVHGLGISRTSLYRAFEGTGGVAGYVTAARLDTARALLFHPEEHRTLGDIAEAIGFGSAAALSKAFQRRFGCSPREARRTGVTRITDTRTMFDAWRDTLRISDASGQANAELSETAQGRSGA